MGEIGILLRAANEAVRRSARRGSGFLACAALRARTSGRLLRRTAARILYAKSKSAPRIAGWRNLPAPGSIPAGRAFRLPGLMKACRWAGCCRRREKKEAEASEAARQSAPAYKTRPPQARLGGLSGWLAQTRAPGPRGTLRGGVSRASSQVWLLRAGRESFERSARDGREGAQSGLGAHCAGNRPMCVWRAPTPLGRPGSKAGSAPFRPHWLGPPSPVAAVAASSDAASENDSGSPKRPWTSWAPDRLSLPPGSDRFSQRVLDQRQGRHIGQGMPGAVIAALRDGGDFPLRDRGKIHPLA